MPEEAMNNIPREDSGRQITEPLHQQDVGGRRVSFNVPTEEITQEWDATLPRHATSFYSHQHGRGHEPVPQETWQNTRQGPATQQATRPAVRPPEQGGRALNVPPPLTIRGNRGPVEDNHETRTASPGSYFWYHGQKYQYAPKSYNDGQPPQVARTGQSVSAAPLSRFHPAINRPMVAPQPVNHREGLGIDTIRRMINELVGLEPTGTIKEYAKAMKGITPPTYDGKDDDQVFMTWLSSILMYFRRLNVTGPSSDVDRIELLPTMLAKEAATWMYNQVQSPHRTQVAWSFEDVIIEMYRRFVVTDIFSKAEVEFKKVRYDPKKGVVGLRNDLDYWGLRMIEPPGDKGLRDRFLTCLPPEMERELVLRRGLDSDSTPYQEWCDEARRLERLEESIALRRQVAGIQGSSQPSTPQANRGYRPTTIPARNAKGKTVAFRPVQRDTDSSKPTYVKQTSFIRKDNKTTTSTPQNQPRTNKFKPASTTNIEKNKVTCYNC